MIGFAWVLPDPGAWWIVVRNGSLREVYASSAKPYLRLPVRITTRAGAKPNVFVVDQYSFDGKKVSSARIEAAVAG